MKRAAAREMKMGYKAKILEMMDGLDAIRVDPIGFAHKKSREPLADDLCAKTYANGWAEQSSKNIRLYLDLMETENMELADLAFGAGSK